MLPPLIGKQLSQSAARVGADAFEDVAQVSERIDIESLARGDEASQDRRSPSAIVTSKEHPVFPSDRDTTQTVLGTVVVDLHVTIFAVADER